MGGKLGSGKQMKFILYQQIVYFAQDIQVLSDFIGKLRRVLFAWSAFEFADIYYVLFYYMYKICNDCFFNISQVCSGSQVINLLCNK